MGYSCTNLASCRYCVESAEIARSRAKSHVSAERALASAALARFHLRFAGATPAGVLHRHAADAVLCREATPEPIAPASAGERDPLVLDPGDFRP